MVEHSSWEWGAAAEAPTWGFHGPSIWSLVLGVCEYPNVFFKNIKKPFYFEIITSLQKNCKNSTMDSHNTLFPRFTNF